MNIVPKEIYTIDCFIKIFIKEKFVYSAKIIFYNLAPIFYSIAIFPIIFIKNLIFVEGSNKSGSKLTNKSFKNSGPNN